jgi:8-oxo-dGTP diphosphatase
VRSKWEHDPIDVLAWVCVRNARMLATRTRGNTVFYAPGGKRQTGESDWEALAREVDEELGLTLAQDSLSLVTVVQAQAHGQTDGRLVRMTCYAAEPLEDVPELRGRAEVEEVAWLAYGDRARCAPAAAVLLECLHNLGHVD